jgi:hypothetical protein
MVVVVNINGQLYHALLDLGSFSDFVLTMIVDQLKLKLTLLDKPLPLQLAVSGFQGKVKQQATANLQYQMINKQ